MHSYDLCQTLYRVCRAGFFTARFPYIYILAQVLYNSARREFMDYREIKKRYGIPEEAAGGIPVTAWSIAARTLENASWETKPNIIMSAAGRFT